jgi:hypothetical protein
MIHQRTFEVENYIDPKPIFDALERRDDKALWAAESAAPSQQLFFERLKEQVGFTTYLTGAESGSRLTHHCSLLMVPFIAAGGTLENLTGKNSKGTIKTIVNWLSDWIAKPYTISSFHVPLHYQEVSVWGPSLMRERLDQLITKHAPKVALDLDFNFQLPPDAPMLSFLVTAVHSPMEWAVLPPEDMLGDLELESKISGALQFCAGSGNDIHVLEPKFSSEAIRTGIMEWIKAIHETCGINSWDAIPVARDMVILHLSVGEQDHLSPIPLRAYQIGLDGVETVLGMVGTLCKRGVQTSH